MYSILGAEAAIFPQTVAKITRNSLGSVKRQKKKIIGTDYFIIIIGADYFLIGGLLGPINRALLHCLIDLKFMSLSKKKH